MPAGNAILRIRSAACLWSLLGPQLDVDVTRSSPQYHLQANQTRLHRGDWVAQCKVLMKDAACRDMTVPARNLVTLPLVGGSRL